MIATAAVKVSPLSFSFNNKQALYLDLDLYHEDVCNRLVMGHFSAQPLSKVAPYHAYGLG